VEPVRISYIVNESTPTLLVEITSRGHQHNRRLLGPAHPGNIITICNWSAFNLKKPLKFHLAAVRKFTMVKSKMSATRRTGIAMTSSDCRVIVGFIAEVLRVGYGCNGVHFSSRCIAVTYYHSRSTTSALERRDQFNRDVCSCSGVGQLRILGGHKIRHLGQRSQICEWTQNGDLEAPG